MTTNADSMPDSTSSNMDFLKLDAAALGQIRKTSEDPRESSIYDVIRVITGQSASNSMNVWSRLVASHPELLTYEAKYKFPGRGQQFTPVCSDAQLALILKLLPGIDCVRSRAGLEPTSKRARRLVDDLYIMRYVGIRTGTLKIGRSSDAEARRENLESCQDFRIEIVALYPGWGHLERSIHTRLEKHRSTRGAGTEWFAVDLTTATTAVRAAILETTPPA